MPEKPDALISTQQIQALGLPLVAGGIEDQPYIWMMEYRICLDISELFENMWAAQKSQK